MELLQETIASPSPAASEPREVEGTFTSWDGTDLFYRAWLPADRASKALLLFHRGHEHSARWRETVNDLDLREFAIFAWDQRGHGHSSGERGAAANVAMLTQDADAFARHVCETYNIAMENVAIVAHSVGAVVAAAWVHDFAPPIRAMVLATSAFSVKLYVPLAIPLLRLKRKLIGAGTVKSYVKARMLTHDQRQAREYESDPLIFRQISVNVLLDLHDTSKRLLDDAGAIEVPTLLLAAGKDWIVKTCAQRMFFKRLGSRVKQMDMLEGFHHAIFHEADRRVVNERIRDFIQEAFRNPRNTSNLAGADRGGFTRTEYDLLRIRSRHPRWPIARGVLKTVARLSEGIRLGWKSGFDSGATLDYVYENRPRGISPLGRWIDRTYLNSPGWSGVRVRRENLQRILRDCISRTHEASRDVRILDVASGPGRYVLETIHSMKETPITATLRDFEQRNLDAARKSAEKLQLDGITTVQGDAFDRDSLAQTTPRPTIAIASGIYELFSDNESVLRSLNGIADALEDGGCLIYTNQPWHPQLEFIARVLRSHRGGPWIMRRRTQAEIDELVHRTGFEKLRQEIDPSGVFTVCLAQRRPR